jgi:hypothetical protein
MFSGGPVTTSFVVAIQASWPDIRNSWTRQVRPCRSRIGNARTRSTIGAHTK